MIERALEEHVAMISQLTATIDAVKAAQADVLAVAQKLDTETALGGGYETLVTENN